MAQPTIGGDRSCDAHPIARLALPATGSAWNLSTTKQGWISSGRNNPCPVCGRDVDDKCRRSADLIACYVGERFSPPPGLRLGDCLQIDGRQWAVVSLNGGFAGNSVILRPDLGRQDFAGHPRPPRRRELANLAPTLQRLLATTRRWVHKALAVPEFMHCDLVELRTANRVILTARDLVAQLLQLLQEARRAGLEGIDHLRHAAAIWSRLLAHQAADLARFCAVHLGEPSPAAVEALEADLVEVSA